MYFSVLCGMWTIITPCLKGDPLASAQEEQPIYNLHLRPRGHLPSDIYSSSKISSSGYFMDCHSQKTKYFSRQLPLLLFFFTGLPLTTGRCWIWFPKALRCILFSFHHKLTPKKMLLDKLLLRLLSTIASEAGREHDVASHCCSHCCFAWDSTPLAVEQLAHHNSAGPWSHEEYSSGGLQCQIQGDSQQFSFGMECYIWSPSLLVLLSQLLLEQEQMEEWKGLPQQQIALSCLGSLEEWWWTKRVLEQEKCAWLQEGITSRNHGQDTHHRGRRTCLSLFMSDQLPSPHSYLVLLQLPPQGARILASDCVPSFISVIKYLKLQFYLSV